MARRISSIVAAMMLLGGAGGGAGPQDAAVEEAKTSARAWLVLHDGREFDQSWEAAGDLLQVAVTQKEWTAKWSVTMAPLGKVVSRGVKSAEYATDLSSIHFPKRHTKPKGGIMDGSNRNGLPTLFADTENLQRQLEQRYQQLISNASRQADRADTKRETGMVVRGK